MEELDWVNNKGAIGCFVSNGGMKKLYVKTKEWSDYTSGELTDGWCGFRVDGLNYHVFTKYWDYIEKPKTTKQHARKLIILNAPKGCGKDVAAEHLVKVMYNFHHVEFKTPVKELVKSFYSLTEKEHNHLYLRENKELPQDILHGKSIQIGRAHV